MLLATRGVYHSGALSDMAGRLGKEQWRMRASSSFLYSLSIVGVSVLKIALAADHGGLRLKNEIKAFLEQRGHEIVDCGCDCADSVDYPDYAIPAAQNVLDGVCNRAILVCGTGIGMSIVANKMKGIRCALVHDTFSAKATREHNDTNVLALGERVVGPGLALEIVAIWVDTPFSEDVRHERRIKKISALE
jgi:ribose 5-phosphate isomerase B